MLQNARVASGSCPRRKQLSGTRDNAAACSSTCPARDVELKQHSMQGSVRLLHKVIINNHRDAAQTANKPSATICANARQHTAITAQVNSRVKVLPRRKTGLLRQRPAGAVTKDVPHDKKTARLVSIVSCPFAHVKSVASCPEAFEKSGAMRWYEFCIQFSNKSGGRAKCLLGHSQTNDSRRM